MAMIQLDSELVRQALDRVQDNLYLPDLRLSQRSPIEALIRAVQEADSTVSQPEGQAIAACPGCGTPTGRCEECGEVIGPNPIPLPEAMERASTRSGRAPRRAARRRSTVAPPTADYVRCIDPNCCPPLPTSMEVTRSYDMTVVLRNDIPRSGIVSIVRCPSCNRAPGLICRDRWDNDIYGSPVLNIHDGYHRTRAVAAGALPADDVASTEEGQEAVSIEPLNVVVGAMDIVCPVCEQEPGQACVRIRDRAPRAGLHYERRSAAVRVMNL